MKSFTDEVAVIAGAASGVGSPTAKALSADRDRLALVVATGATD